MRPKTAPCLKSPGKGAVILPHGVRFRGGAEAAIRKEIIGRGYVRGIISLPANRHRNQASHPDRAESMPRFWASTSNPPAQNRLDRLAAGMIARHHVSGSPQACHRPGTALEFVHEQGRNPL